MSIAEDIDATGLMARIEQASSSAGTRTEATPAGGRVLLPNRPLGKLAQAIGDGDSGAELVLEEGVALPETPYRCRIGVEEVLVDGLAHREVIEPGLDRRPQVIAWFPSEVAPDGTGRRPVAHANRGMDNPITYKGQLIGRTAHPFHAAAECVEIADPVIEHLPVGRGPFELDATGITLTVASIEQRPRIPTPTGKRERRLAWQAQMRRAWIPSDAFGAAPGPRLPHQSGEVVFFAPTGPVVEPVGAAEARVDARNDWDGLIIITIPPLAPDSPQGGLLARLHWSMQRTGRVFVQALVNAEGRSLAEAGLATKQTPAFLELHATGLPPVPGRYELAWALIEPADRRGQRP
jgi:hypothetical protein